MVEIESNASKRALVSQRLRDRYPDDNIDDEEVLFDKINNDYDDYDRKIDRYSRSELALKEAFDRDPRSALFLADMADGRDPWVNMIRRVGVEGMTDILNDPARQEAFEAANKEYLERVAKSKEYEQKWEENMETSRQTVADIQAEQNIDDDRMDAALDLLGTIATEVCSGTFSRANIEMALKALGHDADVEAASREAEIRGRNAKVEATLRRSGRGDGVPMLGGSNTNAGGAAEEKSVFDLAAEAQ